MQTYTIDPIHSAVEFAVKHMRIATVKGRFLGIGGEIHLDEITPQNSWVDVKIDAAAVDTGVAERDRHLRSPDFLNVKLYPRIHFRSTQVEPALGEGHWHVLGNLTIREITRQVSLDTTFEGRIVDLAFQEHIGFTAQTTINRRAFGINWNVWRGPFLIEDEVKVVMTIEADRPSLSSPSWPASTTEV